jgi:hypothetical protein
MEPVCFPETSVVESTDQRHPTLQKSEYFDNTAVGRRNSGSARFSLFLATECQIILPYILDSIATF